MTFSNIILHQWLFSKPLSTECTCVYVCGVGVYTYLEPGSLFTFSSFITRESLTGFPSLYTSCAFLLCQFDLDSFCRNTHILFIKVIWIYVLEAYQKKKLTFHLALRYTVEISETDECSIFENFSLNYIQIILALEIVSL